MGSEPRSGRQFAVVRNRPLLTLALGHFTVDMYIGVLPMLYPLLTARFDLDLKTVGLVSLAYSGGASLSQPFFGWLADRHGTRLIGLALSWTAITFALLGFVPNFSALVVLAGLSGIGSGAYHPLGALNASAVIAEGQRNTAMSIYTTGGTLGVAIGPLIGAAIFALFGLRGTALMLLPGLSIAVFLLVQMRATAMRPALRRAESAAALAPAALVPLAIVIGVMMFRAWTLFGLQAYIPTWYASLGYGAAFYGPLATMLVLGNALGAVGAGTLADRYGRRLLILGSIILSVPTILLFAQFTGPIGFVTAALIGLLGASTTPLLLVLAQQLMVGRAGMASGLILGLGFVTGAIGVPIMGAVADAVGLQNAIRSQAIVAIAAIGLAWFLPGEDRVRMLTRPAATVPDPRQIAAAARREGA
jgi:FSR family fosmidomycin resistance protein-like MFS transporter